MTYLSRPEGVWFVERFSFASFLWVQFSVRHARILKTRTKFEFRDDIYARLPPMNDSWLASGELLATGARDSRCCSQSLGRTTAPAQGARGPQALRLLVATGSLLPRDQPARSSRSCGPHGQMGWPRLSPRGGGLLPVASTLSSVLRHLRNRATVSSSSSSCECAALCRATPSAHQTARAQQRMVRSGGL